MIDIYKLAKDNQKEKIINIIKTIIPIGKYDYTENVISRKDIDKLIKEIQEMK